MSAGDDYSVAEAMAKRCQTFLAELERRQAQSQALTNSDRAHLDYDESVDRAVSAELADLIRVFNAQVFA